MEEIDQNLFKKKLKKLKEFKGRGTELISLYIPEGADRSTVMGQITEELSQSSNIKSATTRKNVQGALRKINHFLKQIDFKIPVNGLAIFCGNISEIEGKSNIKLFTVKPVQKLKTKLYWCDSTFHLDPLEEMLKPTEIYALIVMDKREATVALLKGKKYEILGRFTSGVAGKTRAGGQSSQRFERLREEAAQDFFKRVSEKMNQIFLEFDEELKGVIVGGPGITKNNFLKKGLIDHRLTKKIIGIVDTSYTDESGIREIFFKSEQILKDTEIMKEKATLNKFLEEIVRDGLVVYGEKEVIEAINEGKASKVLLSEGIEWLVLKIECSSCGKREEFVVKDPKKLNISSLKCSGCNSAVEVLEEIEYAEYVSELANNVGAEVQMISTETSEGEQFLRAFGGIGAFLRYK